MVIESPDIFRRPVQELKYLFDHSRTAGWTLAVGRSGVEDQSLALVGLMGEIRERERAMVNRRANQVRTRVRHLANRPGRRRDSVSAIVAARVVAEREGRGATWQAIADTLSRDGVPTSRGGRWHPSAVRAAYSISVKAAAERDARRRRHYARHARVVSPVSPLNGAVPPAPPVPRPKNS